MFIVLIRYVIFHLAARSVITRNYRLKPKGQKVTDSDYMKKLHLMWRELEVLGKLFFPTGKRKTCYFTNMSPEKFKKVTFIRIWTPKLSCSGLASIIHKIRPDRNRPNNNKFLQENFECCTPYNNWYSKRRFHKRGAFLIRIRAQCDFV